MKRLILTLFVSLNAHASYFPSAPQSPSGYDEIRTSNGVSCRSSNGGNFTVYGGVYGNDANNSGDYYSQQHHWDDRNTNDAGVHIGFSYNFNSSERIDCTQLYDLEVNKQRLELEKLRAEVEMLRKMQAMDSIKIPPPPIN